MATFWDNFNEMFREAQEAHKGAGAPGSAAARRHLTREEFRAARATEDAAIAPDQRGEAAAARLERYEDALWQVIELARDQEKLIEHRRNQRASVSDVDVARWLALRKASKKAAAALGLSPLEA